MIAPVPAGYLIVIVVLGALVLIHELGHFLAALVCRLPVSRFSIGFGPALWSLRYRGVEYRLSLFPLGGYVLPGGRHPERFFDEPPRKRLLFCLGGPAANLFVAFLLLALFNVVTGSLSWQAVWGLPLAQLGVALKATLRALASLAAGDGELSGVVGVLTEGSAFVGTDTLAALQFAIVMSVNLAVLNSLPLPPLDGGKALLCLVELLGGSVRRLQVAVNVAGLAFLLGAVGYAMFVDLGRLLS